MSSTDEFHRFTGLAKYWRLLGSACKTAWVNLSPQLVYERCASALEDAIQAEREAAARRHQCQECYRWYDTEEAARHCGWACKNGGGAE
jgi:hypothetical protein